MAIGRKKEDVFFTMFRDFADALVEMGGQFSTIFNDYQMVSRAMADMKIAESECDVRSHEIIQKLNESFITPFDREDICTIANQLDDLADYLEETVSKLVIYDIAELRDEAVEMGNVLTDAVEQIKIMFDNLPDTKKREKVKASVVEINRLENIADSIYRTAISRLFKEEKDPVNIIKWKDIYETLEDTLDACEHLADTVEGVMIKNA